MSGILGALLGSFPVGAAGAFESIATATGTGSSGTITFSNIPGTYQHLQIRGMAKDTGGTTGQYDVAITFNSDTGSNYAFHALRGTGSSVLASGSSSQANIVGAKETRNSNTSLAVNIIDIHDYANTSKNKTLRSFAGYDDNGSGDVFLLSGVWLSTSAITSITLTATVNFSTTTTFALYGIKG